MNIKLGSSEDFRVTTKGGGNVLVPNNTGTDKTLATVDQIDNTKIVSPNGLANASITDEGVVGVRAALSQSAEMDELRSVLSLPTTATLDDVRTALNLPADASLDEARVAAGLSDPNPRELAFSDQVPAAANNGTLTIQQNGKQLGTFGANQSSNTTVNVKGVYYATCSTAENTKAKEAVLADNQETFTLEAGVTVYVKFTYRNHVYNPTITINGSTAKSIYAGGYPASLNAWEAGDIVRITYDGSSWWSDRQNNASVGCAGITVLTDFIGPDTSTGAVGNLSFNKAMGDIVAKKWVISDSFVAGEYVTRQGYFYKAKVDIPANTAWNSSNWDAITVMGEMESKIGDINTILDTINVEVI